MPSVWEFLQQSAIEWLLLLAAVATLVLVFMALSARFRDDEDNDPTSVYALGNYREMHDRGMLSDEEYQTIKARISARVQAELKHNDKQGSDTKQQGS